MKLNSCSNHAIDHKLVVKAIFAVLLLIGFFTISNAFAVCCGPVCGGAVGGTCGDCTTTSAYCGNGSCNMFGCNCDGGCRTGRCDQLNAISTHTQDKFSDIDEDADGAISFIEASQWLRKNGKSEIEVNDLQSTLKALDSNDNNVIDAFEFDNDLAPSEIMGNGE